MHKYTKGIHTNQSCLILGEEFPQIKVPVGGDQLTRERLQWAKALRSGALTSLERLDNLSPMIVELFHTIQDFLEVISFN